MTDRQSKYVILGLAVAVAWRLIIYDPVFTPDSERFIEQARSLVAGNGFVYRGEATAALAPGYPLFLAGLSLVKPSLEFARAVQVALSVLSCLMLYRAVRPACPGAGIWVLWALALHPMVAAYSWAILSESFAIALGATLVLLVSRAIRDNGMPYERFFLGVAAGWRVLTTPTFVFIFYPLSVYLVWRERRVVWNALAYVCRALVLVRPWQMHYYSVTGFLQPAMVQTSTYAFDAVCGVWTRSWLASPEDLAVGLDNGELIRNLPDRDFSSPGERERLAATLQGLRSGAIDPATHDAVFQSAADANIQRDPIRYYLWLPAERALILWTDMPQLGHFDPGYIGLSLAGRASTLDGPELARFILRWGKGIASLLVYILYLCYPIAFLLLEYGALKRRSHITGIIVAGVLAYTFASAIVANAEIRRNLPFVPLLLFLAYFACRPGSAPAIPARDFG